MLLKQRARGSDNSIVDVETNVYPSNSKYLTCLLDVPTAIQKSHGLKARQIGCPAAGILIDLSSLFAQVSQNLTVPSLLPDTINFESGEMSSDVTSYEWALKVFTQDLTRRSHILTLVSTAPDTTTFIFCDFSAIKADVSYRCPVSFPATLFSMRSQLTIVPPYVPSRAHELCL